MEFLYPSMTDLPDIETVHIETPSPVTEGGIKGLGEGGLITSPAAVVNAVADALNPLGVILDRLPLNPDYVLGESVRPRGPRLHNAGMDPGGRID